MRTSDIICDDFVQKLQENYGDVLKPKDVQEILHIGRAAVLGCLADGSLKSIKVGTKYIIPKAYLVEFMYPDYCARTS